MLYSEKIKTFEAAHPCRTMTVDGAVFRYVLEGKESGKTLIKTGMSHIRNESSEEIAYAQDMFETIFKDYKQEKDVHISSLLADLMNQTPVTADDFAELKGHILLILPDQDFFSGKMQEDLIRLMHEPKIAYVSGGHLSTVLKTEDYIRTIREFVNSEE